LINGYYIETDKTKLNIDMIHSFLSKSYWAKNISIKTVSSSIDNSICFGVYTSSGEQCGFARVITDCATFAYLADIFILDKHRGKGLSKWLLKTIIAHNQLQDLRRIMLRTEDAHELYKKFGFKTLDDGDKFLVL
jgi:GNAT superfamily N-acetyltransferase